MDKQLKKKPIEQPVSRDWHTREEPTAKERNLTVNPGDIVTDESKSVEEKAQQVAVDAPDITGDWIKVPTYFIFEYPNGEKKALHHVKDAKEISDAIRLARFEEDENLIIEPHKPHNVNLIPFILVVLLVLFTIPILIGIF